MNEQVASELIEAELTRFRTIPYSELVRDIGKPQPFEKLGRDGRLYQLEVEVFWDGGKGQDVRVVVAADDGGIRAFKPLTGDFIMRADGSFVGEPVGH